MKRFLNKKTIWGAEEYLDTIRDLPAAAPTETNNTGISLRIVR